jgi:Co/Zn/Cd efflux system component
MRRIVRLAAILNLTYFGVEFAVALAIGSVSLFADSIDFLEDTAVNFLVLLAPDWNERYRARMGMVLAGVLLVPGVATLWTAWRKFTVPVPPSPLPLSLAGAGRWAWDCDHERGCGKRNLWLDGRNTARLFPEIFPIEPACCR